MYNGSVRVEPLNLEPDNLSSYLPFSYKIFKFMSFLRDLVP